MRRACLLLVLVVGCTNEKSHINTCAGECPRQAFEMPTLASAQTRAAPSAPAADVTTLAQNNTDFATALYGQLGGGNLVFSPFSISLALAMAEAGSATTTETAMLQTLRLSLSDSALHPAFNSLCAALSVAPEGGNAQMQIANTLVVDKTMQVTQAYLDNLAQNYGAKVRRADFINDPSDATSQINEWVSGRTNGKINPLFANTLESTTRLVLVNAIYLNAAWASPFGVGATGAKNFVAPSGAVSVATMTQAGSYANAVTSDYTAVQLPYADSALALLVVMPTTDLASFSATLDSAAWTSIASGVSESQIKLSLPKFKIAGDSVDLVQPRTTLGMGDAFSSADFSRMSSENIAITHIVHRAYISVDEAGTEAAAATGVTIGATAVEQPPTNVQIDHPFIFALRDTATGSILFLGQVTSPE